MAEPAQQATGAAPYGLKHIWLRGVEFTDLGFPEGALSMTGQATISHVSKDGYLHVQLQFSMLDESTKGSSGFRFVLSLEACFTVSHESPSLPPEKFARENAAAMLFPFVRELLCNLSARTAIGPLVMPPINFVELAKSGDAKNLLTLGRPVKAKRTEAVLQERGKE